MAAEVVDVIFRARWEQLERELSQWPGAAKKEASRATKAVQGEATKQERAVTSSSQRAAQSASRAWSTIGTAAVGAASAAAAAIWQMSQRIADLRNDLSDMSARTGVSTDTLAGLRLAAEGAGADLAKFESGLAKLGKRMRDAQRGSATMSRAFADLGVSVTGTDGELRDVDAVFREVVASLQATENPAERAALAVELMGRSGGSLAQSLGQIDLDTFIRQAKILGTDVGPEAAASAASWQRAMAELRGVFDGALAKIIDMIDLGPRVRAFALGFVYLRDLTLESLRDVGTALGTFGDIVRAVFTGDLQGAADGVGRLRDMVKENADAALQSAQAFWETQTAIDAGGQSSADMARELGRLGDEATQTAAKVDTVAAAAKRLQGTYDALESSADRLLDIEREITSDLETQEQAIRRAAAERANAIQREIAGLQQILQDSEATAAQREEAEYQIDHARELLHQTQLRRTRELQALEGERAAQRAAEALEAQAEVERLHAQAVRLSASLAEAQRATRQAIVDQVTAQIEAVGSVASAVSAFMAEGHQMRMADIQEEFAAEKAAFWAKHRNQKESLDRRLEEGEITQAQHDQEMEAIKARRKAFVQQQNERRRAARKQFNAQKNAQRAQAVIDASRAILALVPAFAYLGPGATAAAAGVVGIQLAASLRRINRQKPPEFSLGGSVADRLYGSSGDHQVISARLDEGIVSPRGMRALGPDGLEQINRGEPIRGPTILQLDSRTIAEGVERAGRVHLRPAAGRVSGRAPVYGRG